MSPFSFPVSVYNPNILYSSFHFLFQYIWVFLKAVVLGVLCSIVWTNSVDLQGQTKGAKGRAQDSRYSCHHYLCLAAASFSDDRLQFCSLSSKFFPWKAADWLSRRQRMKRREVSICPDLRMFFCRVWAGVPV